MRFAGIEAGGTSFKIAIAENTPENVEEIAVFETSQSDPNITISQIIEWLKCRTFDSIGIASFGPIDLNEKSKTYGFITSTPKKAWQNFNLLGSIKKHFPNIPIKFETDVNAPAIAELNHGNHGNVTSVAYITVGTGIGVGLAIEGNPVHGLLHPEAGHMFVPLHEYDVKVGFKGTCPFHYGCVEGMSNSMAIAKRKDTSIKELELLSDDDSVWDIVAHYLAHLCFNLMLVTSVEVIVVGGGVFRRKCILPKIHKKVKELNNDYVSVPKVTKDIENYIVYSKNGDNSGIVGALELSRMVLLASQK